MLRLLRALALTATCLGGGLLAGAATSLHAYSAGRNPYEKLDVLARVLTDIELYWVDQASPDALVDDAISGMVSGLDRHSLYLDAETWGRIQAGNEDGLDGLGLALAPPTKASEGAEITRVVSGGPADRAGARVGDLLIAVDGVNILGWETVDVARLLDGEVGTPVRLTVRRYGAPTTLSAIRDRVVAPAVEVDLLAPGWGYARILHFRHRVSSELVRGIESLEGRGEPLRGLVLDLRDNPGGVLEEAVAVADLFVGSGLIVETRGRVAGESATRTASPSPNDRGFPLVILVNGGSASASEIVAGALHDLGRATLVGSRTYGKGSVQSVYEFGDGSALKLTVARYYLAKGETIADGQGIVPDVEVEADGRQAPDRRIRETLATVQLDPAVRAQIEADLDLLRPEPEHEAPVQWAGPMSARLDQDRQLATAWRTLRGLR